MPPLSKSDYDLSSTNTILFDVIWRPIKKRVVYVDSTKTRSAEFAIEHIMDGPRLHWPSRKESENQRNIDIKFTALAAKLSNLDSDSENRYIRHLDKQKGWRKVAATAAKLYNYNSDLDKDYLSSFYTAFDTAILKPNTFEHKDTEYTELFKYSILHTVFAAGIDQKLYRDYLPSLPTSIKILNRYPYTDGFRAAAEAKFTALIERNIFVIVLKKTAGLYIPIPVK